MNVADFDYELPASAIAQEPLAERDASRLLLLDRASDELQHRRFSELPQLLRPGDLLVVNRSRVLPARLIGRKAGSGGEAEVLLVRPQGSGVWQALVWPGRRLRPGHEIVIAPELRVRIESESQGDKGLRAVRLLAAEAATDAQLLELVERHGHVPLPPYIEREDRPSDRERYQTVYASEKGSVAAPTAGLHFTPALLAELAARGVERAEIVLHVGPGTFLPVKTERVEDHRVAPEPYLVPPETSAAFARARARGGRIVAVGTTSLRTLETAVDASGALPPGGGETDLVVVPGHRFQAVDALVTNFHLPRSSLLLLVSAFARRERVLAAYAEALRQGYRFYSYGDAMLIQ
ncbi:MAG: tRNA preQ1(34) S-adenosylmethionine ribosyltransferase-isomerase QueA [Vicinamibacteria bacterium]